MDNYGEEKKKEIDNQLRLKKLHLNVILTWNRYRLYSFAECGFWLFAEIFLFQSAEHKNKIGY